MGEENLEIEMAIISGHCRPAYLLQQLKSLEARIQKLEEADEKYYPDIVDYDSDTGELKRRKK